MLNRQEKIQYLKQYRQALSRFLSLAAERDEWLSIGLGVPWQADTPVKGSSQMPSKIALAAERREALLPEIERELSQCRMKRAEIVALIEAITPEEQQHVLRLVYINGYTWDIVAATMGYSTRQARRLHDQALDDLYFVY